MNSSSDEKIFICKIKNRPSMVICANTANVDEANIPNLVYDELPEGINQSDVVDIDCICVKCQCQIMLKMASVLQVLEHSVGSLDMEGIVDYFDKENQNQDLPWAAGWEAHRELFIGFIQLQKALDRYQLKMEAFLEHEKL